MRTFASVVLTLVIFHSVAIVQPSRTETARFAAPHVDISAHSQAVPDGYAITGQFERTVVLRFKYQTDLLAGLENMVVKQKIRNAVILAGTGSVRNYHFHVVSNRTFPSTNIFVKDTAAPADIVSMNGYVIEGRVHAHITLADAQKAFGGHLEPGTSVFTFAIVTVGIFKEGIDLHRIDDKTYR
jgi:predicted DNA-binding protein with PD1-like motif